MYHHDKIDSRDDCVQSTSDITPLAGSSAGSQRESSEGSPPDKPPITNRGAQISIPLINQFLIDWVSFTFKITDPHEVIPIIGLKSSLFSELERGIHGYRKSLRFGNIGIYYDGQPEMGCHVSMSGQGCRQYESQFPKVPWFALFATAIKFGAKFTRLDLANDNVDGTLDLARLKDAIINSQIRTRFKSASENKSFSLSPNQSDKDDGHTIYFGKRSSRVYMRFYDKQAQMGTPLPWNRAELELKEQRAHKAALLLSTGFPVGELFVGILNQYLAVINLDNENISRCTVQDWWSSWLQSTEKIKLAICKEVKTIEQSMDYVKRQYSPTFAMIKEHLGTIGFGEYMRELVEDGKKRMTMKHEQMMFLSSQRTPDNYNHDQEEYQERVAIMHIDGGIPLEEAEKLAKYGMNHNGEVEP